MSSRFSFYNTLRIELIYFSHLIFFVSGLIFYILPDDEIIVIIKLIMIIIIYNRHMLILFGLNTI